MERKKPDHVDLLRIIPGIALIFALAVIVAAGGIAAKDAAGKQGKKYLEFALNRSAEEMSRSFGRQEENLQALAHMTVHVAEEQEMDMAVLAHLLEKTSFDGIEFTDNRGNCTDMKGKNWDVSGKPYYLAAKQQQVGYVYDDTPEREIGGCLLFYAPMISDSRGFYGMLTGYYSKDSLRNMLDTSFWGEKASRFLCLQDGTIAAASISDGGCQNITDYFETEEITREEESAILDLLELGNGNFSVGEKEELKIGAVSSLKDPDFSLVEILSAETLYGLYAPEFKTMQYALMGILVCLAIYSVSVYCLERRKSRKLEKKNRKISMLLAGVQGLFEYSILIDYETGTYEILECGAGYRRPSEDKGSCAVYEAEAEELFYAGNPDKPLLTYLRKEYVCAQMRENVDILNYEYNEKKNRDSWHAMHIICLERKEAVPSRVLITIVDISRQKRRQAFQKKITELLYGKTYDLVGQIDIARDLLVVADSNIPRPLYQIREEVKYSELIRMEAESFILPEDREEFLQKTELFRIRKELEDKEHICMSFHHYNRNGEIRILEYHFGYYSKEAGILIWAEEDITEKMDRDPLTGVLTLEGFARKASYLLQKKTSDEQYVILHFDIKEFKAVNTLLGYRYGNLLLQKTAERFRNSELNPLEVARGTADHFYCLIRAGNLDYDVIEELCYSHLEHNDHSMVARLHCGIYFVTEDGINVRAMCDKARLACSRIESGCIKPYALYQPDMEERYLVSTEILNEFDQALQGHQFHVWYQPIYAADTGKIASAEALVRWEHPHQGTIPPDVFIPTLEAKGNIARLDLYVQRKVQYALERQLQQKQRTVPIAINLSRLDFIDEKMVMNLLKTLEAFPEAPSYIRFEITESAFIHTSETMRMVLKSLHAQGVKILIDDFGTGYSGLSCLAGDIFDMIKLDMSFIRSIGQNPKTEIVICNVIRMSHELGAEVIAEGVETQEQFEFLRDQGCDYIQGYYFSRPVQETQFEALLAAETN